MRILALGQRSHTRSARLCRTHRGLPGRPVRRLREGGETQQFGTFIALYVVAVGGRVRLR